MQDSDDIRRNQARCLDLFAWLWAWFTVFHLAKTATWAGSSLDVLMLIAAVAVIARPASLSNFLALIIVQLAVFWHDMPNLVNHAMFAVIANLTILAAVLREAVRHFGQPIDKAALYRAMAPVLRIEVAVLYFFAVFHKLNSDFFLPEYSAAVEHYENLSMTLMKFHLPGLPMERWALHAAIYGTLILESAIPILVILRPTRILGIWVGLLFHFMLSVEDFYDFSSMAYALLFLFAPDNFPTLLEQWWQHSRLRRWSAGVANSAMFRTFPPMLWIALFGSALLLAFDVLDARNSFRVFKVLWVFYGAVVIVAFAGAIHGRQTEEVEYPSGVFRFPSWVFVLFPILVFLNGASPYLGLKTRSCFAMFSNLRTEGGTTNHLIVPAWTQVAGYQRDMVQILESSDPALDRIARDECRIPFYSLRSIVSQRAAQGSTDIRVVYIRDGETVTVDQAERDPELSRPHPLLARKLLLFGEVNRGPHQINRH